MTAPRPVTFLKILVIIAALIGMSTDATARHRNRSGGGEPGNFDYYLLSLSWSPAFCLSSPSSAECNGPRRFGFIVHGLWPQNERGWPENCGSGSRVPDEVASGIADLMPARGLVYHEWSAHGTCTGLNPTDYFALIRRAFTSLAIPAPSSDPRQEVEQSPSAIAASFLRANSSLPPQSVVITCSGQSVPRLREVHVCLGRDLAPRGCSADALRGACRAATVIVPPIR